MQPGPLLEHAKGIRVPNAAGIVSGVRYGVDGGVYRVVTKLVVGRSLPYDLLPSHRTCRCFKRNPSSNNAGTQGCAQIQNR